MFLRFSQLFCDCDCDSGDNCPTAEWLSLIEDCAAPFATLAKTDAQALNSLAPLAPCFQLLPAKRLCAPELAQHGVALQYWRVFLWFGASVGFKQEAGAALARAP